MKKLISLLIILNFIGCVKQPNSVPINKSNLEVSNQIPLNFFANAPLPGVTEILPDKNSISKTANSLLNDTTFSPDNGDVPVILGNKLNNPYSLSNIQLAYNTLYGSGTTLVPNHLYVRFKPANSDQLAQLEDNNDLELQDFPMDYEVLQDGDYYQNPNLGTEDIPWLYTVVPVGYSLPPGIQSEIIESIYIPNDNLILEELAESMAAGATYQTISASDNSVIIERTDIPGISPANIFPCDPENCGGGGGGGEPAPNPNKPKGQILVQDVLRNANTNVITNVPLRQARIVAKRWFKIDRINTDNDGNFLSSKKFNNKVKVIVKTKNDYASVRKIRGIRLWQILFPVKKRIGVFNKTAMASITHIFTKPNPTSAHDKELPYWAAATTHNSVVEFRQYAAEMGVGLPPNKLKIIVSNWGGGFRATGATPMFNKCNGNMSIEYAGAFLAQSTLLNVVGGIATLVNTLKNQVDMMINYLAMNADYTNLLTSDWLKSLAYHELGHAAHYNKAGCDFWTQYRGAIVNELTKLNLSQYHPYGTGGDLQNAPIIATGEMWGNHCQYIFSNRHYGNGGAASPGFRSLMQGTWYFNNTPSGLNCNLWALENHNPKINELTGTLTDPWQWIPQGLCYDLIDNRNDNQFLFSQPIDNVSGYTTLKCFNALQSDVRSIPAFKNRLLLQNGNDQLTNVNILFSQYGY